VGDERFVEHDRAATGTIYGASALRSALNKALKLHLCNMNCALGVLRHVAANVIAGWCIIVSAP
jgi:hypothetical protein